MAEIGAVCEAVPFFIVLTSSSSIPGCKIFRQRKNKFF